MFLVALEKDVTACYNEKKTPKNTKVTVKSLVV
jgi:hypothetical protein